MARNASYLIELACWRNQVEIYFSVVQRKVLGQLEEALLAFQQRYEKSAAPFQWTFTREDLAKLMIRLRAKALLRRLKPANTQNTSP